MLKVTTLDSDETIILKLEGRLAGPWVEEATRAWTDTVKSSLNAYVVDLCAVTFIDRPGKALLAAMSRKGAQLVAKDCLTRNIVDEIQKETSDLRS